MSFLPYVPTNTKAKLMDVITSNNTTYTISATQSTMLCLTQTTTRTITLPASPFDNQQVVIVDEAGSASSNNITIDGNGKLFSNGSGSVAITKDKAALGIMFDAATDRWKVWLDTFSSTSIEPIEVATDTYTVTSGSRTISMTYSGLRTVTLPASPAHGQNIIVIDSAGTANVNNISINGNGKVFDTGEAYLLVCKTKGVAGLIFDAEANKWSIYINDFGATGNDNYFTRNITSSTTLSLNTLHKIDSTSPLVVTLPYGTEGAFIIIQEKSGLGKTITIQVPQIPADWTTASEAVLSDINNRFYGGISIAPDNLNALACSSGNKIHLLQRSSISNDWNTATFSFLTNTTTQTWRGICIAPDNLNALVCVNSGQIYSIKRIDLNDLWTNAVQNIVTASSTRGWNDISIAPNNLEALATVNSGRIYLLRRASLTDNWTTAIEAVLTNSSIKSWRTISIAPDNLNALAPVYDDKIYLLKRNSIFESWTVAMISVLTNITNRFWHGISIAPDNLNALATFNGGICKIQRASTSVSWTTATETVIAGAGNRTWNDISIAPNNLEVLSCVNSERIYRLSRSNTWSTERINGDTDMQLEGTKWSLQLTYSGNEWSLT